MIIIETCPRCGTDLQDSVIATNPPIPRKECPRCHWSWEGEREPILRKPFTPIDGVISEPDWVPTKEDTFLFQGDTQAFFQSSACLSCGCNPANGGSGNCNCTLGAMPIT